VGLARAQRIGRYELLIELGRGGMAELFLGRLTGAGGFAKLVAIKRILPHLTDDPLFKQMFLDEGRIAAHLSHPNVCQVFELEESDGELFLAMEYLDGVPWEHLLAAAPRERALALTTGVLAQACEGLHYAHTLRDVAGSPTPVIHRDVSPQNLFVTVDGVCKILDFGVSKMMTDGPRTTSGVIKGKLPYMAPEQIRGDAIDARADVFSLGVVVWEALAGARLFQRDTDFQIWKAITEQDAPHVSSRWPECPPAVDAVVARALERDADRRHASARQFAEELRAAAGNVATLAEIADAVKTSCADRLADRARKVADAIVALREIDPSASETIEKTAGETVSMLMRRGSVAVKRRDGADPDAAATTPFPSSQQRALEASATLDELTRPPKSRARTAILVGLVAAIVAAIAIVLVTRSPDHVASAGKPTADAAPAKPQVAGNDPWIAPDANGELSETSQALAEGIEIIRAHAGSDTNPVHTPKPPRAKKPIDKPVDKPPTDKAPTPPEAQGTFSIDSRPYATIYIDGNLTTDTPLFHVPLRPGPHHVRAVLPDGRTKDLDIVVRANEDTNKGMLSWPAP
jgi:protein kinase-like protein